MKLAASVLAIAALAGCSAAPPTAPTEPKPASEPTSHGPSSESTAGGGTGVAVTISTPDDDGEPDASVPLWDGSAGLNTFIVRIPSDGAIGCPAPAALTTSPACTQKPLAAGYYYSDGNPAHGMLDTQGRAMSHPYGDFCPPNSYLVNCQPDFAAAKDGLIPWGKPPAELGCTTASGDDYIGPTYCCLCR